MDTCLHFVGFWDQDTDRRRTFNNAVQVFGPPDFVHRHWDHRAVADVAPGDTVVFGTQQEWDRFQSGTPDVFGFDDSALF